MLFIRKNGKYSNSDSTTDLCSIHSKLEKCKLKWLRYHFPHIKLAKILKVWQHIILTRLWRNRLMVGSSTDTTSCGGQSDWVYQNSFDINSTLWNLRYIFYTHTHIISTSIMKECSNCFEIGTNSNAYQSETKLC